MNSALPSRTGFRTRFRIPFPAVFWGIALTLTAVETDVHARAKEAKFTPQRIQARLQEYWREIPISPSRETPVPVKLAQRRIGDPVSGPALATVWVSELILSPDEFNKLAQPSQQEKWLNSLQQNLRVQESHGAWYGDTYFLFGLSPHHSRTFVHSIRIHEGRARIGAGLSYLAPQFHSVVRETFLLQLNWMKSNTFPQAKALKSASILNPLSALFSEAHAQQLPRQIPNAIPIPTPQVSLLPTLPNVPVQQYMPTINAILSQGQSRANQVIQNAANKTAQAIQSATQNANAVVNNAAQQANSVVNNAATQSSGLIQQATQSAAALENQLYIDTSNLLQQSGAILQKTTTHAINSLTAVMGGTAAQVAVAATLGAGVADGMLSIGTDAIQYFLDWIKGVDDVRAFQAASSFLEAHSGMILTQRQRITSMLNSLDSVGELTADRLDEFSSELEDQSQFFQDREEYWKKALKLAAGKSNTQLYSKLNACKRAEMESSRVLNSHSSTLAATSEILRAKLGNGQRSSIKNLVCERVEDELGKLIELETQTYRALGEYLNADSTVNEQALEEANDLLIECKQTGSEKLQETLEEAIEGFEQITNLTFCSEEWIRSQNEGEADSSQPTAKKSATQYAECLKKQASIIDTFKKVHGPEIARLKGLKKTLSSDPQGLERACEDYASLKSGALLSSLSKVTSRYLCYSGKAPKGNSACLYSEGGPLGEGGFNQYKSLLSAKQTRCSTRGSLSSRADAPLGQLQDSTSPECRTIYEKYVSPLIQEGQEWSEGNGETLSPKPPTPPVQKKSRKAK